MSRLDSAIKSVPASSSLADDSDHEANQEDLLDETTQESEGDTDDADEQPAGKKGKRNIDNVRGELLRKMEKQQQDLLTELNSLREAMLQANQRYGVPANVSPTAPKTLDDMSIAELEALRGNVPEDQKATYEAYLQERKIDAKVQDRLNKFEQVTERKTAEQRFNQAALDRWPQLRDRQSEFYRVTDRILGEMGPLADNNPRAVLDAANEAGLEIGLSPATGVVHRGTRSNPSSSIASGRTKKSAPGNDSSTNMEELRKIADGKLRNAMPGGKFTDEQLKRIAERSKFYQNELNTRVRG